MSTLWPARGEGPQLDAMRGRWAAALAGRVINAEGYVHTHQHDGPAHAEGWPFPLWTQAGGIGWHFASTGVPGYDAPHATPEGWKLTSARGGALNAQGWPIELTADGFSITPRLPSVWKELSITRIHLHDHVLDLRITADKIEVTDHTPAGRPLDIKHPPNRKLTIVYTVRGQK